MQELKKEKACGCIIIDNDKVLVIQQSGGWWGFPKGHVEGNETEIETAVREVKEETNLDVVPDENKRYVQEYAIKNGVLKQVVFFLAKKVSNDIKPQECEVQTIKWLGFREAIEQITYDNTKNLLKTVLEENNIKY